MSRPPFHLAIPVDSIERAAPFYEQTLGCARGRSSGRWIDYDFFGHQLVIHQVEGGGARGTNPVDGGPSPLPETDEAPECQRHSGGLNEGRIPARSPATSLRSGTNPVDGDAVPVPHFGVVLDWDAFDATAQRLRDAGVAFEIEPRIRFAGQPGEQKTMFVRDPSGNALEFKSFLDLSQLFAT